MHADLNTSELSVSSSKHISMELLQNQLHHAGLHYSLYSHGDPGTDSGKEDPAAAVYDSPSGRFRLTYQTSGADAVPPADSDASDHASPASCSNAGSRNTPASTAAK